MKKYILAVSTGFVLSVLTLTGCAGDSANSYTQISMDEAIEMMEAEENYIILDVRTKEEYDAGHIEGAINIANEVIHQDQSGNLPDKDQIILVYCRSGNRSKQASEKLVKQGYTNVYEFGGIINWPGDVVVE